MLWSGRAGSGLVVARLADGSWSAPSAIATGGMGFGGQIGAELTDFVFVLNNAAAVKTFSQAGSLTLGGNVSIAAGPIGRNAEAAGAASLKNVSAVFSYSMTKGLFAGISLEGSVIGERRDANEKLYGHRYTAAELLTGCVRPPPEAEPLMRVLNTRVFSPGAVAATGSNMYNDMPVYNDNEMGSSSKYQASWQDETYDAPMNNDDPGMANTAQYSQASQISELSGQNVKTAPPGRPTAPKPSFGGSKPALRKDQALANFTFEAAREGDLSFRKGDIITIVRRSQDKNDWWTGRIGDREGVFPANYVETLD